MTAKSNLAAGALPGSERSAVLLAQRHERHIASEVVRLRAEEADGRNRRGGGSGGAVEADEKVAEDVASARVGVRRLLERASVGLLHPGPGSTRSYSRCGSVGAVPRRDDDRAGLSFLEVRR